MDDMKMEKEHIIIERNITLKCILIKTNQYMAIIMKKIQFLKTKVLTKRIKATFVNLEGS